MNKPNTLKFAALSLGILIASLPALAKSHKDSLAPITFGYFCSPEVDQTISAEDTIAGAIGLINSVPDFFSQSTTIPAQIGITFGIKTLDPLDVVGPITIVNTHPPMGNDQVTRESYVSTFQADQNYYAGYAFEETFELVTGAWTLTGIATDGRVVFTKTFHVVAPSAMPAHAPSCNTTPMTS